MDRWLSSISSGLYPLWLIGANMIARLGGMLILVMIGHTYSESELGTYFGLLAMIGLAVTATQAGSGPLLIRLAQGRAFHSAALVLALRVLIAAISVLLITTTTSLPLGHYWPLVLIPLAAALAPDWIITAQTRFSRLGMIAVAGQTLGIAVAVWASLTQSLLALYMIAPAISLASLVLSTAFAFEAAPTQIAETVPTGKSAGFGLVGFTLLAGFVPNLDFVLLGTGNDALFLAQRIFLFCAGLIAAIASTLFAKQQTGKLRDVWLLAPMAIISGLLFLFPTSLVHLVYNAPSHDLINTLKAGAIWPILLAVLTRLILTLQENPTVRWIGWLCLATMATSAFGLPNLATSTDIMALIVFRMACLVLVLFACQKAMTKRRALA
ncbi:hypothetical protein UF64_15250 [Thalassospira sp. HJ]|uniref:hypothetical protein n=1 Tax=Thalassospira sp. HJ TaxID=1616823 RepID=UPI0005CF9090|nr:hypothetical protein [Thalassospira sp. HJ]KJE34426.1 hypothetical protein UF64_15250 [Thalassospira sp. HJ]